MLTFGKCHLQLLTQRVRGGIGNAKERHRLPGQRGGQDASPFFQIKTVGCLFPAGLGRKFNRLGLLAIEATAQGSECFGKRGKIALLDLEAISRPGFAVYCKDHTKTVLQGCNNVRSGLGCQNHPGEPETYRSTRRGSRGLDCRSDEHWPLPC